MPGSNGNAPYKKWKIGNYELISCPLPMVTEQTEFFLRVHKHYVNGILLFDSGLMNQPNKYLEAMEILG